MPNTKSVHLNNELLKEFEEFKTVHGQKDGELMRLAIVEYLDKRKPTSTIISNENDLPKVV